jgi:hypothetical protein
MKGCLVASQRLSVCYRGWGGATVVVQEIEATPHGRKTIENCGGHNIRGEPNSMQNDIWQPSSPEILKSPIDLNIIH